MTTMNGELSQKKSSSTTQTKLALADALFLVGLGIFAVVLHATFRTPLQLPGRRGIEWMALLIAGRATSRYCWAATISATGAGGVSVLPMWGFDDPFGPLTYFLPGLVVDLIFNFAANWQTNVIFLATLGALAHATKPIVRVFISLASGWQYESLWLGVGYLLTTYLFFGFAGGLIGAGVVSIIRRIKRERTK